MGYLVKRGEVVRGGVAKGGRRLVAEVAFVVPAEIAAAERVALHPCSSRGSLCDQLPVQTAGRFSMNAAMPSCWSCVSNNAKNA